MTPQQKALQDCIDSMLKVARMAEALKRECGMDPESAQAIRNSEYMSISYAARAAITQAKQALAHVPDANKMVQARGEAVLKIRTWTKPSRFTGEMEGHGEIVEWMEGCSTLEDGEHCLFAHPQASEPVGINGLTQAETDASMSVRGLSNPTASEPAWRPIETAPKDFVTEFDGWNGERVPSVSWAHPEYSPKGHYAWCVSEYENHNGWINTEVKNLTHWMPIPAAPL
jgi:hypothetical protein